MCLSVQWLPQATGGHALARPDVAARPVHLIMWTDPSTRRLTSHELEIALLLANGLAPHLIARRLGISVPTVTTYLYRLRDRLQLTRK